MINLRLVIITMIAALFGFGLGWWVSHHDPLGAGNIKITGVDVRIIRTTDVSDGTKLRIVTMYENIECEQVLLSRFLIHAPPTPTIVLPRQLGPTVLPIDESQIDEYVYLDDKLTKGPWHLFSVASCYRKKDPLPSADVSPVALSIESVE